MFSLPAMRNGYGRRCHFMKPRPVACRSRASARRARKPDRVRLPFYPFNRAGLNTPESGGAPYAVGRGIGAAPRECEKHSLDWSDPWVGSFGGTSSASLLG